jgi:L-asparaginase
MIGILFTGGTISMRLDPATGAVVPALGAREILAQVEGLDAIADIEAEDVSRLPGPHVTPGQMWRLARRAAAWLERPDIDGLVITHGTDTIEETAWMLHLLLTSDKPVVLVGAMRTVSDASWDGPANLVAAVRVAASAGARGHGALVVMNEQILPARDARKIHTEAPTSFAAPEFGPIGIVDTGIVVFRRTSLSRLSWRDAAAAPGLRVRQIDPRVALLQVYTGMEDGLLTYLLSQGARGVAISAYGRGNVPPAIVGAIERAVAKGAIVTISSRAVAGRVRPRYGYDGGGLQLLRAGAILAGDLPASKARLLVMVALGYAQDAAAARELVLAATQ